MFDKVQVFQGENPNVWKYVFEKEDICVEAVLYRYESFEKRTVLCISVQSGCPVGCVFCGTGKKFIRNLTDEEIKYQVDYIVDDIEKNSEMGGRATLNSSCEKFQIMFMSMGEPMLNWINVQKSIENLNYSYPNAQLLISTIGVKNWGIFFGGVCAVSKKINKVGLQFSLHSGFDERRNEIIPYKNKMNLRELRDAGIIWNRDTGRPVYLNICVNSLNMGEIECYHTMNLFFPQVFNLTFSVICEYEAGKIKDPVMLEHDNKKCQAVANRFLKEGYNVRVFDPARQEIGSGCGQLFYVQEWMKGKCK